VGCEAVRVTTLAATETCETCRFDGDQYDVSDGLGTLRALAPMWRQMTEGLDAAVLDRRPAPELPSVDERADQLATTAEQAAGWLAELLGAAAPAAAGDSTDPVARIADAVGAVHDLATGLGGERAKAWRQTAGFEGTDVDARWMVRHVIHAGVHHLREAGRALHLLGAGAPAQEGSVAQLNLSDGGVPKLPVDEVEVNERGVVGDRQATRKHHGKPMQALCLWSTEVIDALVAEGHPVRPGAAGENVTVTGIDWSTLRTGVQLLLGEVLVEVSAYAEPCKKTAACFTGGDFRRMQHDRHPGTSRVYAWVLEPGRIRIGDPVVVEP
jgi:MOSC domain-containing protein YiiM